MDTAVVLLVGLLRLFTLLGFMGMLVYTMPLLVKEPQHRHFSMYAVLAGMSCVATILTLLTQTGWLHITYGALTALLALAVSGLEPNKGWFYNAMNRPPASVGPYLAWASWIGLLLWIRFVLTK